MMRIGLVGCGKRKLDIPAPAKDLYTGGLFKAAIAYALATYDEVFILSAKYGVVHPDTVIEPYDVTLNTMDWIERMKWGNAVLCDLVLNHRYLLGQTYYVHAGAKYREAIWFDTAGLECVVPLEGLMLGQQLQWYSERRKAAA